MVGAITELVDGLAQRRYNTCILNNKGQPMLEKGKIRVIKELLALWKSGEMSSEEFASAVEKVLSV
jgi:hypothetical protein